MKKPAIFLDRDGVICKNRIDHVKSWSEFQFLSEAKESLKILAQLDCPIVVITNQAAINRGMITTDIVDDIHRRMITEVETYGGRIDKVYYCPYRPDELNDCRKPKSGMLIQAAQEMNIDLTQSYMVGDAATDLMAGEAVGCKTFLVLTGRGKEQLAMINNKDITVSKPFTIVTDLYEFAMKVYRKSIT